MALPFRSIFGLAEESGNSFEPGLGDDGTGRANSWQAGTGEQDGVYIIDAESLSGAIPVELRSGAATHSSRVTLHLDDAGWEPGAAEVTTRLTQIYRACPQLFTVVIDEALDMVVTLRLAGPEPALAGPPPLPKKMLESPFVLPSSPGGDMANPFRTKALPLAQAPVNPFASPLVEPIELPAGPPPLPAALNSPFTVAESIPATEPVPVISPFLAAITGTPMAASSVPAQFSTTGVPAQISTPVVPASPGSGDKSVAGGGASEMRLSFAFHSLLAPIDSQMLGVNPAALPLGWRTHLPLSFVKPQFAGGRVVATLAKLLEHADATAKVGLQGVNGDIEVVLPLKEIVRQLPPSEILPGPAASAVEEKTSVNPFLSQAQEEAKRGFVPLKEAPPAMMDPTAPVLSPFRIAAEAVPFGGAVSALGPVKAVKSLDSLDDLKGETLDFSAPATAPLPVGLEATSPAAPAPVASAPIPLSETAGPVTTAERSVVPKASASPASEGSWLRFDGVGFPPAARDLELRAVFGRSEAFTRQLAVDLTAGLAGVSGCVLFSTTEGWRVLAQWVPADEGAKALVVRLPRMFERIHGLAEDLGFESGETFTLRTSQGLVSFLTHGSICLSVLQDGEGSDPGFWEKLLLIARGMAGLRD